MEIKGDKVIFSSGRSRYAHSGIIGLCPELTVSEGYDGGFYNSDSEEWREDAEQLVKEDLLELADYMIAQWQAFKEQQR